MMQVKLIEGGLHVDERGTVCFVNGFDFKGVGRFYTIRAHMPGQPRGWIGHKLEHKWFTAFAGTVTVAVVVVDDWENPSLNLPVQRFTLSSIKPAILHVPPGHASANVMLSQDALLGVFSSGRIEDTEKDNWRYDMGLWAVKP
jgi:dTDP-4-dehydrorhamnose 3,5-epimerase-like enzyme